MKTIEGQFFNGLQPVPEQAQLEFAAPHAKLTAGTLSAIFPISQLMVSPRVAAADRFINFPNGTQLLCADQEFLDRLPQESVSEGLVAWLEKRWKVAFACVVTIFITLVLSYFYGLPALAKRLADYVPMQTEYNLGVQILSWFDEEEWLEPSELDGETQDSIYEGFLELCEQLHFQEFYQLEFREGRLFGPNAFALPGGIIILTDDLVEAAETKEEILAVLAHEIGHVELRHTMRSILQNSIVAAAAAAVTADATSLSVAVSGLPVIVAQRKYSRQFETAADEYAFELLAYYGYSPAAFASIMERISSKRSKRSSTFSYFSTHPAVEERVRRAREAASTRTYDH